MDCARHLKAFKGQLHVFYSGVFTRQDRESGACPEEPSEARLYDPEEAVLIRPRAAATSAG